VGASQVKFKADGGLKEMNLLGYVIQTERLELMAIDENYIEDIFTSFTKDITTYMYPQPSGNINDTEQFVKGSMVGLEDGTNLQLVIVNKISKEFLGCCGLHNLNATESELGIWLKKNAHGHGYGLEAIEGIVNWARTNMAVDTLKYPVDRKNIPSRKIPEHFKGKVSKEYKHLNMADEELDILEYWISLR